VRAWAREHGVEIIREFCDAGKSGLNSVPATLPAVAIYRLSVPNNNFGVCVRSRYDLGAMVNRSRNRSLYDAALHHHGTWRAALTAAGINLANVSRRRPDNFDRETMLLWLRARQVAGESLVYTEVCLEHRDKGLAIRRTFGSWQRAVDEACRRS